MFKYLIGLGACIFTLSNPLTGAGDAEAATVRYSFDITQSTIGYSKLTNLSTGQTVAPGSADHTAFVSAHHAQGEVLGARSRVRLEIETGSQTDYPPNFVDGDLVSIACLSGVLCDVADQGFLGGPGVFEHRLSGGVVVDARFDPNPGAYLSSWVFDLMADTGTLSFSNDADVYGGAALGGSLFEWQNPYGVITFANISRTEIIPNPLPAPVFLLGAALVPLGMIRRRKARS